MGEIHLLKLISQKIDAQYDQVVLIFTIFLTIPMGLINYLIKKPTIRLVYGFLGGFFLQYLLYGTGVIHTIIASVGTWFFIDRYGRKRSSFWVFILTFVYLAGMHLYRMVFLYGKWTGDDTTIIYMMTICKYSSMAFSYEDGGKDDKDLKNSHWKQYKIQEKPSLLEVCSFTFYYPTSIIGPGFEFKDFRDFINWKGVYSRLPYKKTFLYGGFYLLISICFLILYGGLGPKYPLAFVGTIEYGEYSMLYKLNYLTIAMLLHRSKFYCGWILTYTSMILCGLAYNEVEESIVEANIAVPHYNIGKTPDGLRIIYDKGEYGSVFDCELGLNPKTKITSWNRTVHLWLKYNLFLRMINIEKKGFKNNIALATFATFMMSAVWHGFYASYYIFFFLFFIYQISNEIFDKLGFFIWIRQQNILIKALMCFFSQFMCNSLGAIIFNLRWTLFIQFIKNIKGLPIIFVIIIFIISKVVNFLKKRPKGQKFNQIEENVDSDSSPKKLD